MRKLMGVELTKMRYYRVIWATAVFAAVYSILTALNSRYTGILSRYPQMEYVIFLYASYRMFSILAILTTAYVINEDFSMRTVQNVLSVGTHVMKYYFARLFSQMLFVFCLYLSCYIAYAVTRVLSRGEIPGGAMPFWVSAGVFFVMAMQLMAYVAFSNMISIFCRRQSVAVVAGEVWLFLAILFEGYREMGIGAFCFMEYEPLMVMQSVDTWVGAGAVDRFLRVQYVASALFIMAVTSMIGYVRFIRSDIG